LSVSELAAVGLPSILVPYPFAADDHQRSNARLLVEAGGALLVEDRDLDGAALSELLDGLLGGGGGRLDSMRRSLVGIARPDATSMICDDITALLETGEPLEAEAGSGNGA